MSWKKKVLKRINRRTKSGNHVRNREKYADYYGNIDWEDVYDYVDELENFILDAMYERGSYVNGSI